MSFDDALPDNEYLTFECLLTRDDKNLKITFSVLVTDRTPSLESISNIEFINYYSSYELEILRKALTPRAVLSVIPVNDDSEEEKDDDDDDDDDDYTLPDYVSFWVDNHHDCYCRIRGACGCGCDPDHDGGWSERDGFSSRLCEIVQV